MAVRPFVARSWRQGQPVHRLAVLGWQYQDEVLFAGEEASHLCHVAGCYHPDHIVVEDHLRRDVCGCGLLPVNWDVRLSHSEVLRQKQW